MVKGTCLADPRRKVGTPQKLGPESPQKMAPVQCYLTWSKHKQSINKMQQTWVKWMHRMKEEVIWRILVQESLDLVLCLKRYGILKFRGYFVDFSEARDIFGIIFQMLGVWVQNLDHGLIS
jgi:hypothetical protein